MSGIILILSTCRSGCHLSTIFVISTRGSFVMVKLLFLLSLVYLAASIDFYVPLYTPVCLNYDWQKSTVIHGPYSVKDNQDWFRLTVTVLSSEGEQVA
jgi:hypothetical protein